MFWLLLPLAKASDCELVKISLQKLLFSGTPIPDGLQTYSCESNEGQVALAIARGVPAKEMLPLCSPTAAYQQGWPLAALLSAVGYSKGNSGGILDPVSAAGILSAQSEPCPKAFALVSLAVDRLPVFGNETIGFLSLAERTLSSPSQSLLDCPDAIHAWTKLEAAAFFSRVDSNEFYTSDEIDPASSYATHQTSSSRCLSGQLPPCSIFRALEVGLPYWEKRGITQDDVNLAFKPVTDLKLLKLTKAEQRIELAVPFSGHYGTKFHPEFKCILDFVKKVDQRFGLPDFELVLNHGDLPLSRKVSNKPPFYDLGDSSATVPTPIFSLASSPHFHDMIFPNVCRPELTNLTKTAPAYTEWDKKINKLFYRGTDRGAINWATKDTPISVMKSLRKFYFEKLRGQEDFVDFALLEDSLFNSSVVTSDPKFVPFEKSQRWKYLLDIPGNGYSGSLKQKLTSSSAVFVVDRPERFPDHLPVSEHFYFGLEAFKHFVPVESADDLIEKIKWARSNDHEVAKIKNEANAFMESFIADSQCYFYRLIKRYAAAQKFSPELFRSFYNLSHYRMKTLSPKIDQDDVNDCLMSL